ncbi:uncharacterized protein EI90DRAFT_1819185 [Cantharellus anzutake]|uniref:uncharacterized protein n=1 Tax=Cantharellus anzutake TaxID=1750568 RepID=UPI001902D618|nr:uncharacterized protein EI90DRAFT_1819185 [Cantharellus anzutake]KAF8327146.1 hypothetical protein EI90DRAFT_1819185 [Cantharellus anzutake]
MDSSEPATGITVSVPTHLQETLINLDKCKENIPSSLHETIRDFLNPAEDREREGGSTREIRHHTLHQISRWAQSEEGRSSLRSHGLDPADYLLISLLSGVTSLPFTNPPPYDPDAGDPNKASRRAAQDRRAVVALLNALFSILGVGIGSFWIAGSGGWKLEHRTLFALFTAVVIATTEGILYLIWSNRASQKDSRRRIAKRLYTRVSSIKDDDPDEVIAEIPELTPNGGTTLRKRIGVQSGGSDFGDLASL